MSTQPNEPLPIDKALHPLRKVLDPPDEGGSYVQTVPRRGYRFAASIKAPKAPRVVRNSSSRGTYFSSLMAC